MFEEIKEMIDSTVYPNGNGEVTAQNINLAMQGIVEAAEEKITEVENKVADIEGNGTGGNVAYVYVSIESLLSDVQIEENKKSYVKILNGADLKVNIAGAICNAEFFRIESGSITFGVVAHGTAENSSGARICHEFLLCILSNDGTVIVDAVDDYNTPAPSGPLRVWINEANTTEQVAENAATYNAIMNNNAQNVIAVTALNEEGTTMTSTFNVLNMVVLSGNLNDVVLTFATEWENGIANLMSIILYEDGTFELA